jgi:type I restriction enzyme S subunit
VIGPDQSGWLCGTGCFFIKRSTQVDSRFLAELLGAPPYRQQLEAAATGTTMKNLSNQALQNLSVSFPPLSEQQRIVAILDEAFAGLATATANAEKNLKNARELFESYVNSILMDQASKPAAHTMLSICELIVDCEHKTAPTQPEGVASIRTPNIGKGELILEGVNRVSEETFQIWSRRAVPQAGDLIFAREAMAGNVAVIPPNLRCVLGQRTVLIRPKASSIDSMFLAYLLLHPTFQSRLLAHSKGATVQHINMKDIRALGIGELPSIKDQRQVVSKIAEVANFCKNLEVHYRRKLDRLATLKQSILQRAFSGELTLSPSLAIKEAAE